MGMLCFSMSRFSVISKRGFPLAEVTLIRAPSDDSNINIHYECIVSPVLIK